MPLIIEDGSGVSNADAYVSLSECDAYHANLGNAEWEVTPTNVTRRENAIKKATVFIDAHYGHRFKGVRATRNQSLAFPRFGITDDDGYILDEVPQAIKRATCEAALKIFLEAELMPDLDRGGQIISETVGSISITYSSGAPATTKYSLIDGIIRSCLQDGGSIKAIRA